MYLLLAARCCSAASSRSSRHRAVAPGFERRRTAYRRLLDRRRAARRGDVVGGIHGRPRATRPTWSGSCWISLPNGLPSRTSACCCCRKQIRMASPTERRELARRRRSQPQLPHPGLEPGHLRGRQAVARWRWRSAALRARNAACWRRPVARIHPRRGGVVSLRGRLRDGRPHGRTLGLLDSIADVTRAIRRAVSGLSRYRRLRAVVRRAWYPDDRGRADRPPRS